MIITRLLLILFCFIVSNFILYWIDPMSLFWKSYWNYPISKLVIEWALDLLAWGIIVELYLRIDQYLNRYLTWEKNTLSRLILQTLVLVILVLTATFISIFVIARNNPAYQFESRKNLFFQCGLVSILTSLIMAALYIGNHFLRKFKLATIEVAEEKVRTAQLNQKLAEQRQVEAELRLKNLQLQIDPHFIFNNLSVLSELILKDQKVAYEYAENFSRLYRYFLKNLDKELIFLSEELSFLKAYIFLVKIRTGEHVNFSVEVNSNFEFYRLPPFTLQLLIENAIKHNKATTNSPLQITIESCNDDEYLIVRNSLNLKSKKINTFGIGLNNIITKYSLVSEKTPEISEDNKEFTVLIPLIK